MAEPAPSARADDARRRPTVVVARRPAPGRERELERWMRQLVTAAGQAPGYVGAELQPPNAQHPDEWVTIYQFRDRPTLEGWLRSPARRELVEAGAALVDGEPREQVLAVAPEDVHATVVSSYLIEPEHAARFETFQRRLLAALAELPGFVSTEVFEPVDGVQDDTVIVVTFTARRHLDAWLGSDERHRLLREIEPYLAHDRVTNVVGGFGGWFGGPGAPEVRRWKQAALVLLALYPTSLLLTAAREAVAPGLPIVPAVLVTNAAGVAILTWLLMPVLTQAFDRWLRR
jgi:uncharacterized protein